jgi:hypothetical protein
LPAHIHKISADLPSATHQREHTPRPLRDFLAGGVEKLKELNFFKPESDLAEHRETLKAYFQDHPPATHRSGRRNGSIPGRR